MKFKVFIIFQLIFIQAIIADETIIEESDNSNVKTTTEEAEIDCDQSNKADEDQNKPSNVTLEGNVTQQAKNYTNRLVKCTANFGNSQVQIVNDTELIKLLMPDANITSREAPGNCVFVLFYSKYCPFCSMAAPHFNALPRAFPDIKMVAINAMLFHLFNTQNGIMGVPSLVLFHNGKAVTRYNYSEYTLELFSKFLSKCTGIIPEDKNSFVTSADFSGPVVSVPARDTDIFLIICWGFILTCAIYFFAQSKWCTWIIETVKSNWRESGDHAHAD